MNLSSRNIAITDIETSGDIFGVHEILEIGLVLVHPKTYEIIDTLSVKIKPDQIQNAVPAALERNGYSEEKWKGAITLQEGMEMYSHKTRDAIFYAYNVSFDWGIMRHAFHTTGVKDMMDYHRIDLMSIAYSKYRDAESLSFNTISTRAGIPPEPMPHSALNGAMQGYYLLKHLFGSKN